MAASLLAEQPHWGAELGLHGQHPLHLLGSGVGRQAAPVGAGSGGRAAGREGKRAGGAGHAGRGAFPPQRREARAARSHTLSSAPRRMRFHHPSGASLTKNRVPSGPHCGSAADSPGPPATCTAYAGAASRVRGRAKRLWQLRMHRPQAVARSTAPGPAAARPCRGRSAPREARLALRGQRAVWRHVGNPQRGVIPGHVGVLPLHPGQPAAARATAGRGSGACWSAAPPCRFSHHPPGSPAGTRRRLAATQPGPSQARTASRRGSGEGWSRSRRPQPAWSPHRCPGPPPQWSSRPRGPPGCGPPPRTPACEHSVAPPRAGSGCLSSRRLAGAGRLAAFSSSACTASCCTASGHPNARPGTSPCHPAPRLLRRRSRSASAKRRPVPAAVSGRGAPGGAPAPPRGSSCAYTRWSAKFEK